MRRVRQQLLWDDTWSVQGILTSSKKKKGGEKREVQKTDTEGFRRNIWRRFGKKTDRVGWRSAAAVRRLRSCDPLSSPLVLLLRTSIVNVLCNLFADLQSTRHHQVSLPLPQSFSTFAPLSISLTTFQLSLRVIYASSNLELRLKPHLKASTLFLSPVKLYFLFPWYVQCILFVHLLLLSCSLTACFQKPKQESIFSTWNHTGTFPFLT